MQYILLCDYIFKQEQVYNKVDGGNPKRLHGEEIGLFKGAIPQVMQRNRQRGARVIFQTS